MELNTVERATQLYPCDFETVRRRPLDHKKNALPAHSSPHREVMICICLMDQPCLCRSLAGPIHDSVLCSVTSGPSSTWYPTVIWVISVAQPEVLVLPGVTSRRDGWT